jgi:hypothetical protein
MELKQAHLLEKAQVVLVGAGLLAAVFWGLWWWFVPPDPLEPQVFLATGRIGSLALLVVLLAVFSALAGALTPSSRLEGSLLAAVVGVGGLALRSARLEPLLWSSEASAAGTACRLAGEVFVLGAGWLVAMLSGAAVRSAARSVVARIRPGGVWRRLESRLAPDLLELLQDRSDPGDALRTGAEAAWTARLGLEGQWFCELLSARRRAESAEQRRQLRRRFQQGLSHLVIAWGGAVVMVFVLLQSTLRNQVLFSLAGAMFMGVMLACHFVPMRSVVVAWVLPVLTGVAVYGLGALSGSLAQPMFRALPIDWILAGSAGALLGYFTSDRLREIRLVETLGEAGTA